METCAFAATLARVALRSGGQFREWAAVGHDWHRPPGEVADRNPLEVNSQMAVDCREEILRSHVTAHHIFAAPVGAANDLPGADIAAGKEHRSGAGPVVAARLHRAGAAAGHAAATARLAA